MSLRNFIIITIIFSLCCSCEKATEQQGGTGSSGTSKGIPACLVVSADDMISWDGDERIMLRWAGKTYSTVSECEYLSIIESADEVRFEGELSEYKASDMYAYHAADGAFVSKSSVAFRANVPSEQSGRLDDISDYALLYSTIKKEDIALQGTESSASSVNMTGSMQPFFAVLKLGVPSSFGYTQLKMEASGAVAGHVQLNPQKVWGSLGSGGFAYRPTGTGLSQKTSVVISDNGRVLGDEVYVVIAPNVYDETIGNYCSTAQTFKFTLTGPGGDVTFEKQLNEKIVNGTLVDLGDIPGRAIDVALKIVDSSDSPFLVLDSTAISNSISYGARYYFITGTDGLDALPDPTDSDAQLTSDGISIPVQNSSDRLYIKVLGCCDGCEDVALKAIVRNWKYDINFISPSDLQTEYDGLKLQLSKKWSDEAVTDNRIGYIGCQAGKAEITPELEGDGWFNAHFFAGSFDSTLKMFNGTQQLYKIDMPAQMYYSDNDIMKSVRLDKVSASQRVICEWSYRIWLRNMIFLEQQTYEPIKGGIGDVDIEDFDGNINYQ